MKLGQVFKHVCTTVLSSVYKLPALPGWRPYRVSLRLLSTIGLRCRGMQSVRVWETSSSIAIVDVLLPHRRSSIAILVVLLPHRTIDHSSHVGIKPGMWD